MVRGPMVNGYHVNNKDPYFNFYLRGARMESGLSIKQLSEASGVSRPLLAAYEKMRCFPSQENAQKIASTLGYDVNEIFPDNIHSLVTEIQKERSDNALEKTITAINNKKGLSPDQKRVLTHYLQSLAHPVSIDSIGRIPTYDGPVGQEQEVREALYEAMKHLLPEEKALLKLKYGFVEHADELTPEEIEAFIRISEQKGKLKSWREKIRHMKRKAIRKLQHPDRSIKLAKLVGIGLESEIYQNAL